MGKTRTGVTTMRIDAGLDTGDMLLKWETEIGPEEDALELGRSLWRTPARSCLVETLRENPTPSEPQNPAEATYAPILKKEDGEIDWNWPARKIFNRLARLAAVAGRVQLFSRPDVSHLEIARGRAKRRQASPGGCLRRRSGCWWLAARAPRSSPSKFKWKAESECQPKRS